MDNYFLPQTQPILDAILTNLNILRIDSISKYLISGGAITADELVTNADPLVNYISLTTSIYNVEGAARTMYFNNATPTIILSSGSIANLTSYTLSNLSVFYFNRLSFSANPVNAATTLVLNGYRVTLVS